ncbi:uncharacterized protein LOC115729172 [Rhodamnia argentea]|uniref:Uncharacterized protein LOC115729172 n=1 Tax=Rhodamnia argentea TaxID=178133 RepID=A0ABM3HX59_9MYRT|nr:uncharacterized protein LOC115729172 [Rhodamnia argentea]
MKCKKHLGDLSSGAGVCASCLRERLFALMAAQAQAQAQGRSCAAAEDRRKSDAQPQPQPQPQPPPLSFPSSVSPYVSRRKSDHHHHHRIHSTPQVAPTYSATSEAGGGGGFSSQRSYKKKSRKFSLLAHLFRSRSEKFDSGPNEDSSDSDPRASRASPSPSWSSFLPGRRRAQSRLSSLGDSAVAGGRCGKPSRIPARGMSPARGDDSDENPGCDRSPPGNVCSSDSSPRFRKTPVAAAAAAAAAPKTPTRPRPSHARNVSGFAFCLSPLVRASPNRDWKHKGCVPPEAGYSGDVRASAKPHLATATSFGKNRSRKLTDFGRAHHNR